MDPVDIHLDIDSNFEPQTRARSNTWPLRPSRELEPHNSPVAIDEAIDESSNGADQQGGVKDPLGLTAKKSGSRRNAWGNLSYADLITKAIQSSPEKRLTLSQIYDWMVQNVPYFKDKGDSTSSAGWKNSIRHNLSLHSRFMRIQNEGTGKSSWWVLNPDAKPGKTPRRRAGSMETKSYEKKRGRIRKKAEALRAAMENGETLSPGGSDDMLDVLTFGDFRPRASSNASSTGRLSPIHAVTEPDLHENQVPPMSPIPWETEVSGSPTLYSGETYHDLVNSLVVSMKLSNQDSLKMEVSSISDPFNSGSPRDYSNQPSPYMDANHSSPGIESHYSHLPAPPPYPKQQQQMNGLEFHSTNFSNPVRLQCSSSPVINGSSSFPQTDLFSDDFIVMNMKQEAEAHSPVCFIKQEPESRSPVCFIKQERESHSPVCMATPNSLSVNTQQLNSPDRSQQGSPSTGSYSRLSPQQQAGLVNGQLSLSSLTCQVSPQQNRHLVKQETISTASLQQQQQQQQALHQVSHDSILREALTRGVPVFRPQSSANTPSPTYSPLGRRSPMSLVQALGNMSNGMNNIGLSMSSNASPQHQSAMTNQLHGLLNDAFCDNNVVTVGGIGPGSSNNNNNNNPGMPLDIDVDIMGMSGLDYDMDQVIKQELTLEGTLDFNFETGPATSVGQSVVH